MMNSIWIGFDPGVANAGIVAVRWRSNRPVLVACARFTSCPDVPLPVRLAALQQWIEGFKADDPMRGESDVFSYEDQTWSRIPTAGVAGHTNSNASQPMMAQTLALTWAQGWAKRIVQVAPQSVRKAALGTAANFSCQASVDPRIREQLKRQHDKRLDAEVARYVRRLVRGVEDIETDYGCPLSEHEFDAICVCLAGRKKLVSEGAMLS